MRSASANSLKAGGVSATRVTPVRCPSSVCFPYLEAQWLDLNPAHRLFHTARTEAPQSLITRTSTTTGMCQPHIHCAITTCGVSSWASDARCLAHLVLVVAKSSVFPCKQGAAIFSAG